MTGVVAYEQSKNSLIVSKMYSVREVVIDLFNEVFKKDSLTFWERILLPLCESLYPGVTPLSWYV